MISFLGRYFKALAQPIPNKNELHLPSGIEKKDVYKLYKTALLDYPADQRPAQLSLASFGRLWKQNYPTVKCVPSTDFAKCQDCINLKIAVETGPTNKRGELTRHYLFRDLLPPVASTYSFLE